jgi:archaellum biogenesis ATPase FlaH
MIEDKTGKFGIGYQWLNKIMPEGLLVPSSTLISGPGGTGKPLVAFALISSWLKKGGNVIMASLQYSSSEFTIESMKKIYNIDLDEYKEHVFYVNLDPSISFIKETEKMECDVNLLKPEVWDEVNEKAEKNFDKSDLGTLFSGAALNLLLFSKTYRDILLEKLKELISQDKTKSYLFTVSTSAFKRKIRVLEDSADNLLFTRMEKPIKLFVRIARAKNVDFSGEEIEVPLKTKDLQTIKKLSEQSRTNLIPTISKI